MKVFVYEKGAKAKKIATITNVVGVYIQNGIINIVPEKGLKFTFDTKAVKTTIYQN